MQIRFLLADYADCLRIYTGLGGEPTAFRVLLQLLVIFVGLCAVLNVCDLLGVS